MVKLSCKCTKVGARKGKKRKKTTGKRKCKNGRTKAGKCRKHKK